MCSLITKKTNVFTLTSRSFVVNFEFYVSSLKLVLDIAGLCIDFYVVRFLTYYIIFFTLSEFLF